MGCKFTERVTLDTYCVAQDKGGINKKNIYRGEGGLSQVEAQGPHAATQGQKGKPPAHPEWNDIMVRLLVGQNGAYYEVISGFGKDRGLVQTVNDPQILNSLPPAGVVLTRIRAKRRETTWQPGP